MEITEVRIKLMENPEDRLRGFCSITFDGSFVVRDLKIIEGNNGPFVAMPSRKLTSNCRKCRSKNHLKANYCNQCGSKVQQEKVLHDSSGRVKLYADIAHPINAECREMIQRRIVDELHSEQKLAREPGYRSRYDEGYDGDVTFTNLISLVTLRFPPHRSVGLLPSLLQVVRRRLTKTPVITPAKRLSPVETT